MKARSGKFALDTNVIIDGLRDPDGGIALELFHAEFAPFVYLSAVVAHELRVGARAGDAKRVERNLFAPFERRGRVFFPTYAAWSRAGDVLRELREHRDPGNMPAVSRSLGNDVLIALSCREAGVTLVTSNTRDFARIAAVTAVDFVEPWPSARR
ncbi:MAG: type II toxin-antitoxin system VapC family toxin [Gemmatimonadaceae bacterium]